MTSTARVPAAVVSTALVAFLTGCATGGPTPGQIFRNSFLPPAPKRPAVAEALAEPPRLEANPFLKRAPGTAVLAEILPKPTETDFRLKSSEDRFEAGRKAYQEGRYDDARREFNRAIDILLATPDSAPDRWRIERRLAHRYLDVATDDLEEAMTWAEEAQARGEARSIGLLGNAAEILPELVARGFAAGGIDLWRLAAGGRELGYLYALTRAGHVCLYQGGFVRAAAADHRPGLAAHVLAIAETARRGDRIYDFLAGQARYKRSLATASRDLAWVELARPGSAAAWAARLRRLVQRARQTRVDDIA